MFKRTKIVCTMGPACDNEDTLREMIKAGMNVARFNFSHGSYEEHHERIERVRRLAAELGQPVGILLDTKGPEVRTGLLKDHKKVTVTEGDPIIVTAAPTTEDNLGTAEHISLDYLNLPKEVTKGSTILIDDGLVGLEVEFVEGNDIHCIVKNSGEIGERKGVNMPNVNISLPAITERDRADILFGLKEGIDYIAASFIRDGKAVEEIRELCVLNGGEHVTIFPKIECALGVENFDEILEASDGIMVARGDLGIEIAPQLVPHIQKEIIRKCNEACKTVITATQMLDSMIRNPRPTRAEVTDVANAVYDGTDAVMLSGETAMGKYPVDALKMMVSIVEETEAYLDYSAYRRRKVTEENMKNISNAVCAASVSTAHDIGADYIIAPSITGFTSMMLSKWRPAARIIGMSPSTTTVRQMMLQWGVTPVWSRRAESTDELIENSLEELKSGNVINSGDLAVITAGIVTYARRHEAATATNIMRVVSVD